MEEDQVRSHGQKIKQNSTNRSREFKGKKENLNRFGKLKAL